MIKHFLALVLLCFSNSVLAETQPAQLGMGEVPGISWYTQNPGPGSLVSAVAACIAMDLYWANGGNGLGIYVQNGLCMKLVGTSVYSNGWVRVTCPSGATPDAATVTCRAPVYLCPQNQNWTLAGTNCVRPDCVLPQERTISTGVCNTVCLAGFDNNYGHSFNLNSVSLPSQMCIDNCVYSVGAGVGGGMGWRAYAGQNKGKNCDVPDSAIPDAVACDTCDAEAAADPMGTAPSCPEGETRVTYPEGFTCVLNSVLAVSGVPSVPSGLATNGSGGVVQSGPATGAEITVTRTRTSSSTNEDGSVTTTTAVTSNDSDSILQKLFDAVSSLGDFGSVGDATLEQKTINVGITPIAVGGNGSCPASSPMVLHGKTYYFEWTTYCNFANGINPIILVFAWLAAAGILIGGFKSA